MEADTSWVVYGILGFTTGCIIFTLVAEIADRRKRTRRDPWERKT